MHEKRSENSFFSCPFSSNFSQYFSLPKLNDKALQSISSLVRMKIEIPLKEVVCEKTRRQFEYPTTQKRVELDSL